MSSGNVLKLGTLCRCRHKLWHGDPIVKIESRKTTRLPWQSKRSKPKGPTSYFVVARGDDPGYGSWVTEDDLIVCGPLELLALQADD